MDIRKNNPAKDNPYYINTDHGGWNPCILGNPKNRLYPGSVLANCIGAGVGRINETAKRNGCDLLGNRYPGTMIALARAQGLEIWDHAAVGGLIVLVKDDGISGHVESVEELNGNKIYTFESGWNYNPGKYVSNRWVWPGNNYGMNGSYKFAGCIVNPYIDPYQHPKAGQYVYHGKRGIFVKFVQWVLNKEGCYPPGSDNSIDGSCGPATVEAIKNYQRKHNDMNGKPLEADGSAGPLTLPVMINDWSIGTY